MAPADTKASGLEFNPLGTAGDLPDKFSVGRERFYTSPVDQHAYWFLTALSDTRKSDRWRGERGRPLLSFRDDFRRIGQCMPIAALTWCVVHPTSDEQQRFGGVVAGRHGAIRAASTMYNGARFCSLPVRREIVKALSRLGKRREAENLASREVDERIVNLAGMRRRDFGRIFKKWQVSDEVAVAPPDRPFELFVEVGPEAHRPNMPNSFVGYSPGFEIYCGVLIDVQGDAFSATHLAKCSGRRLSARWRGNND